MAHKVSPLAFRIGYTKTWRSSGYAAGKDYTAQVRFDSELRQFIRVFFKGIPLGNTFINHHSNKTVIILSTSKTSFVLGKDDENLVKFQDGLAKRFPGKTFEIQVKEVKKPELSATLVADAVARQIEKKMPYRRVVKSMIQKTMEKGGLGIKIIVSGCLNGNAIARRETYKEGSVSAQTLRSDIDYATDTAITSYGSIGVKVWVYKGNIMKV
ncbi:MAG TPA: 30S ribosomal protein S3 [bacterium]|nr:30S ribosomal protein S3 [bacterium]